MQAQPFFPSGTAKNADFINGRTKLEDGEQVLVCDVDLETLPASGLLCLHEHTVAQMVAKLGWKLQTTHFRNETKDLRRDLAAALKRLEQYDKAWSIITDTVPEGTPQ